MHKSATKCNETLGKWCKNKHGASKIMDTLETYHRLLLLHVRHSRGTDGEPARAEGARRVDGCRGLGQARAALGEGKLYRWELAAGATGRSSGCKVRQPAASKGPSTADTL
jgi:hypothetical protein